MVHQALTVADFHEIEYIYDVEAIALEYGYYNSIHGDLKNSKVIFIDIGYTHINIFGVNYQQNKPFKIEYCFNSTSYGGKFIDEAFVEFVVHRLKKEYDIDESSLMDCPRDKLTIFNSCSEAKFLFSAKTVDLITLSFNLYCYGDDDVTIDITLDEFKQICRKTHIQKVTCNMLERCIKECGDVQSILFEGSLSRLYIFTECVKEVLSRNPACKPQIV